MNDFIAYLQSRLPEFESQNALARKAGLSKGQLSRLLLGQKPPSIDECNRLARALNVEPDTLLKLAGRLPAKRPAPNPEVDEVIQLFGQLGAKDRAEVLRIMRMKAEHTEGETHGKKKVG